MDQVSVKKTSKIESINVDFISEQNEIEYQNTLNPIPLLQINNSQDYNTQKNSKINQIPCSYHKKVFIQFINVNPNNKRKLQCIKCVFEFQSQNQDLIPLNDIFKSDHITFISQWAVFQFPQNKQSFQIYSKNNQERQYFQINLITIQDLTQKLNTLIQTWQKKLRLLSNGFTIKPKNMNIYSGKLQLLAKIQRKNCFNNPTFKEFDQFMNQSIEQGIIFEKEINNKAYMFLSEICNQYHIAETLYLKDQISWKKFIENGKTNLRDYKIKMDLLKGQDIVIVNDSNQLRKIQIEQNSVEIKLQNPQNKRKLNLFYINCEINYYQKYEILIHFQKTEKDKLYILLEPFSYEPPGKCNQAIFVPIFNLNVNLNILRVIQGRQINNCKNFEREQILFQICLSDNIYRLKFGDNVNEINFKWSEEPYKLVFKMFDTQSLIIKYFREVNSFSQF